jgi:predicted DCC family thiol-disulfide oxidoreductase YuxK
MYAVIYDGNCNLCVSLVQLLERLDKGERFNYVPMQANLTRFAVSEADCELGMLLIALDSGVGRAVTLLKKLADCCRWGRCLCRPIERCRG